MPWLWVSQKKEKMLYIVEPIRSFCTASESGRSRRGKEGIFARQVLRPLIGRLLYTFLSTLYAALYDFDDLLFVLDRPLCTSNKKKSSHHVRIFYRILCNIFSPPSRGVLCAALAKKLCDVSSSTYRLP